MFSREHSLESVRQLLIDTIERLELGLHFQVLKSEIRGTNGSLMRSRLSRSRDTTLRGSKRPRASRRSHFGCLRPTIRKEGSELWFGWNLRWDTDAVDKFRGGRTSQGMLLSLK